jgi:transposase
VRPIDDHVVGWTALTEDVPLRQLVAVPVDVGKSSAVVMACDFTRRTLMPAVEFPLTRTGVAGMLAGLRRALPADTRLVRVGVEAAGHYHQPMISPGVWPEGWQLVELNPAHVTAQRRVNGSRGVKTDRIDLVAIADLLLAGRGVPVVVGDASVLELQAWVAHRRRRVEVRTATKNQLLGQLDRAFPGLGGPHGALGDVLGSKVGRLVVAEFADPARLARLGADRFRAYAAHRDVRVTRPLAERLVAAARDALATAGAAVARDVLAADLALLNDLDRQITDAEARISALLPTTDYQILTTAPGWSSIRAAGYAAALGPRTRWPSAAKIYRAAGLTPTQYESAGRRRDGGISREGSVHLRRALIELGIGLWQRDPASRTYAQALRARGKRGGVIACALAHRANKIAFAMVRHQSPFDPTRWS